MVSGGQRPRPRARPNATLRLQRRGRLDSRSCESEQPATPAAKRTLGESTAATHLNLACMAETDGVSSENNNGVTGRGARVGHRLHLPPPSFGFRFTHSLICQPTANTSWMAGSEPTCFGPALSSRPNKNRKEKKRHTVHIAELVP